MNLNHLFEAVIMITLSGSLLLAIHLMGGHEKTETFLFENDKTKYYIMRACYTILVVAIAFNLRFAIMMLLSEIFSKGLSGFILEKS